MELKGRHELFCREYLAKNLHGTNAALAAGYSPDSARTIASQLLAREDIQDRLAELAAERNQELKIEAADVLRELLRLAMQDPINIVDEKHVPRRLDEIPIDLRRTIASIEVEEMFEGRGKHREHVGRLHKIKFWNKNAALEALGRHLALFTDKLKLEGSDLAAAIAEARGRGTPLV